MLKLQSSSRCLLACLGMWDYTVVTENDRAQSPLQVPTDLQSPAERKDHYVFIVYPFRDPENKQPLASTLDLVKLNTNCNSFITKNFQSGGQTRKQKKKKKPSLSVLALKEI